jgi:hypothetical protein
MLEATPRKLAPGSTSAKRRAAPVRNRTGAAQSSPALPGGLLIGPAGPSDESNEPIYQTEYDQRSPDQVARNLRGSGVADTSIYIRFMNARKLGEERDGEQDRTRNDASNRGQPVRETFLHDYQLQCEVTIRAKLATVPRLTSRSQFPGSKKMATLPRAWHLNCCS